MALLGITAVSAATFSYTTSKPQFRAPIVSQQLRTLYTDVENYFAATNPQGWTFPNVAASNGQILSYNGSLAYKLDFALRSNADLLNDDGQGTNGQVLKSGADGTMSWTNVMRSNADLLNDSGLGSAGQFLQSDGDATLSWASVATLSDWTEKTADFTTAAGGRYLVSNGEVTVTLHNPVVGDEFYIKPNVGTSFFAGDNGLTLSGSMEVAGGAAASYALDEDVIYWFITDENGDDYDVGGILIDR